MRFLYEAFFELVLCSLINVSYLDDGAAGGFLGWMVSLVTLIAATGAIIFTLSLYCVNGPYLKSKQYVKGSLLPSFWGIRQLNRELEYTKSKKGRHHVRMDSDRLSLITVDTKIPLK